MTETEKLLKHKFAHDNVKAVSFNSTANIVLLIGMVTTKLVCLRLGSIFMLPKLVIAEICSGLQSGCPRTLS